jgi:Trk-type K+ transport system membrane component
MATKSRGGVLALALVIGYVLLMGAGYAFLRSAPVMVGGNEMSAPRALFTSVNAATMTGFQQTVAVDQYLPAGQWCVLTLTVVGTFITLVAGSLAVVRIVGLPYSVHRVVGSAVVAQGVAMMVGGVLMLGQGRGFFEAMFQACSAFANSGLTVGAVPGPTANAVSAVAILRARRVGSACAHGTV